MQVVVHILAETWRVTAAMAPYLLLGFAAAGVLHAFVRPSFVVRHLGRRGLRQIVKATLIGVPMPLCSCSVIPVTASLRRHGAGKGATAAFIASTPETGIDSVAATYGLLGGVFAVARVAVAFLTGLAAGVLVERTDRQEDPPPAAEDAGANGNGETGSAPVRALRFGFLTLPGDIGRSLLLGLLLAGVFSVLFPAQQIRAEGQMRIVVYALVTLAAVPLYVCSTGSIPIGLAMMRAGLTPGAALIFLVAGPATNTATIAALWKLLGRKAVAMYLVAIVTTAWLAAAVFDALPLSAGLRDAICSHPGTPGPVRQAAAVVLLALIGYALRPRRTKPAAPCCTPKRGGTPPAACPGRDGNPDRPAGD